MTPETREATTSIAARDADRLDDDGSPVLTAEAAAGVRVSWALGEDPPCGAWWPHSRNAPAELRTVLPVVSKLVGGPVTRVSLSIGAWDEDQPRRLTLGDDLVRLGWFHSLDGATVTLGRGGDPRVTLRVVPSGLDPEAAREFLDEVSRRGSAQQSEPAEDLHRDEGPPRQVRR
jgi:hypothetical protein